MPTSSGNLNTSPSLVVGTTERTSNGTGTLGVTSTVSGVAERTINGSGTPTDNSNIANGTSNREIRSGVALQPSANNIVTGAGDRGSNSTGTLQNSANPSLVVGVTERIINLQSGINQSSSSTTTGDIEREVNLNTGAAQAGPSSTVNGTSVIIGRNAIVALQAQSSRVIGNALKEFTATGLETRATVNNIVSGVGDRVIDDIGNSFGQTGNDLQPTLNNIITGLAEREIVLEQGIFSGESDSEQSTLNGVAVVKQTFSASGLTTRPTVNNLVSGVAEREIENNALVSNVALQPTLNNLLAGVAERTINGTGVLADSDSLVSGVAEREIVSISADLADSDNLVAAQVLMSRVATGTLVDSDSKVVGLSENNIIGSGTLVPTTNNLVTGVAEREVEDNLATAALRPTTQNIVAGTAQTKRTASGIDMPDDVSEVVGLSERTVVATGALIHPDSKTRPPLNQAERIMVVSGINGFMLSGDVTVTVNANVGRLTSGAFKPTDEHLVTGVAEREITATGLQDPATNGLVDASGVRVSNRLSGIAQTDPSTVTGVSERVVTATGVLTTGPSVVTGLGERQVDLVSGVAQVDASVVSSIAERIITVDAGIAQVDASEVAGLTENIINGSGSIQVTDSSDVVGSGFRTVHTEPTSLLGDTANSPDGSDSQIEYVAALGSRNPYYIRLSDVAVSDYEGLYQPTGNGQVVSESGLDYIRTPSSSFNSYYKFRGSNVDLIVYNTTRSAWYVTTASVTEFLTNSSTFTNGSLNQIQITTSSETKAYGSEFDPIVAPDNLVAGLAERIIVDVDATPKAGVSTVNGFAERKSVANGLIVTDITIQVVANIGRLATPDLTTGTSRVLGVAENIIVDDDASPATGPSTVAGVAERTIVLESGIEQVPDLSDVVGAGVRTSNLLDGIEQVQDPSDVAGVAERTVVLEEGIRGGGGAVYYPDDADGNVTYSGLNVIIGGMPLSDHNGTYVLTAVKYRAGIVNSAFRWIEDDSYRVFQKNNGDGTYNFLAWNTTFSQWDIWDDQSTAAEDATTGSSGTILTGAQYIVANGAGNIIDLPGSSLVEGVAERQIDLDAGISQVDASVVAGIAERTINGAGVIVDNSNLVNGVSEREIRTSAAIRPTTDNLVTGIAERTINLFQSPQAEPSQVTGLSERIINYFDGTAGQFPGPQSSSILGVAERVITLDSGLFSGESDSEQSTLIGLGERTINLVQGLIQDSDLEQSHVVGLSERIVNLLNGIDMPDDVSEVNGAAERIVVLEEGIEQVPDLSDVNGLAERIVVLEQGIVQDSDLEQSHVVGLSERTIVQTGGGALKPIDNNLVTAVAEREIEINEVTQELKPTDNNLVTGLAERIIVLEDGIFSGESDSEQSYVVALLDSAPILTIVRKPIEDAVQAQSSEVDTVDADRVVRQIPDGLGPVRLSPAASDPNVSYSGNTTLTLSGIVSPVPHNHDYTLLPQGFTVATSGFTDYIVTVDNAYNSYVKHHGPGDYHVVAYSTTANEWVVFESTSNPILWTGGEVLGGSASGSREVATLSDFRNGPFKVLEQTSDASVTGVAEREIEINDITQDLQSGPSTIVGAGFRTAVEEEADVQAQPSTLQTPTGSFAERIIEVDVRGQVDTSVIIGPSSVSGVAERIIEQNEQNANLQGTSSSTGVAERIIGWQRGDLVVPTRSRVVGVAEREIETNGVNQRITNEFNPSRTTGVAERTINLFQGILSNTSDSEQSHTDNALFPSQGFRTSNLIVGIRSNDSDEQASVLAGTIDGSGERVIISDPRTQPEITPSLITGIAERKIDMSIFGLPIDNSIVPDPSTVTGVAERIVELEKGIGIPSVTPWQEIIQGNSFDWSLREGYNNDSSLGWNNGIVNDERNYTGIFNLPFVDKDFYGRTKNVYEIRSPQMSTNGEPDSLGAGIDPSKPSRLTNRFVRLDSDAPWTGEFETYYQPAPYYEGWDSTAKSGIAALFNLYDSSGDLIGQPARWNRTPQNWVVYREWRDPTHVMGRRQVESIDFPNNLATPYKLTAAGSQYHKDHDLAWSDSGGFDLDNGYRYPRQLFYYPFYNGENQASFYREGPHPGKWSYVFWGADDWIVFINEDVSPSQLAEGYAFNYRNVTVDVGRYYNLNVDFSPPLNVQEAFDSTVHRGWHNFPFDDIYSTSFASNPTRSLWRSPQGQFDFDLIGGLRTGPVLQDSDAQIELAWKPFKQASDVEGYTPWIDRYPVGPNPDETSLVPDDSAKVGVWTLDSAGQDPATLPIWNTLRYSGREDYSGSIGPEDDDRYEPFSRGNGWITGPLSRIVGEIQFTDSNPEYAKIYHATDDADIDGVAERKVVSVSAALVVDTPSVVVGIAEREIEINEITQEIKPIEHNIVTGVAERIITVDEGIRSADDFLEEQSKVTAIVYTNNLEQSRIHTKRKFVLRKERTKTFIVRQTPTG